MTTEVLAMRQLIFARGQAISECLRLGADAAHAGKVVNRQGIGGMRIQQYLKRQINPSPDHAYDFVDGTTKIQLKGPFLTDDTLEPIPNVDVKAIAENINGQINTGYDRLIIDTLGLTDEQAVMLDQLITLPHVSIR